MRCDLTPTDAELLMRFRRHGESEAFEALMQRHASMVMGVCLQVLQHRQDAEDVFQATFLTLIRRASSIRRKSSLASWLYRVAHRLAVRHARRRDRAVNSEPSQEVAVEQDPLEAIHERWLLDALHRELDALPDRYRAPLVLFYLEGCTRRETAAALECTDAIVKGRLTRGRQLLRTRMARRGAALTLALAAMSKTARGSEGALASLISRITALVGASGGTAPTAESQTAFDLARQGAQDMFWRKVTSWVVVAGVLGCLGVGWTLTQRNQAWAAGAEKLQTSELALVSESTEATGVAKLELASRNEEPAAAEPSAGNGGSLKVARTTGQAGTSDPVPPGESANGEPEVLASELRAAKFARDAASSRADAYERLAGAKSAEAKFLKSTPGMAKSSPATDESAASAGSAPNSIPAAIRAMEAEAQGRLYRAQWLEQRMLVEAASTRVRSLEAQVKSQRSGGARNESDAASGDLLQAGHTLAIVTTRALPDGPIRLQAGAALHIAATGTLPDGPIRGVYRVEQQGTVALGPQYGRAAVAGKTLEEAEAAIREHLKLVLRNSEVQVALADDVPRPARSAETPRTARATQVTELEQRWLAAARKGYEAALADYEHGRGSLEPVCEWSRRWLAAELDVRRGDATKHAHEHRQRMDGLHRKVSAMQAAGAPGGDAMAVALMEFQLAWADRQIADSETKPSDENELPMP